MQIGMASTGQCSGWPRTVLHFPGLTVAKLQPNISRIECETNENDKECLIRYLNIR